MRCLTDEINCEAKDYEDDVVKTVAFYVNEAENDWAMLVTSHVPCIFYE